MDMQCAQRRGLRLKIIPDTTWLSTHEDFDRSLQENVHGKLGHFVMDRVYPAMRQKRGLLMENGLPIVLSARLMSTIVSPTRGR